MGLEIKNLGFAYTDKAIFKGLNFAFSHPSRVLLCGQNGSGKTTLLKLLAGFLAPEEGHIHCEEASDAPPAFLGHEPPLYPALTVKENIMFWLKLEAATRKEPPLPWEVALTTLEQLGVDPFTNKRASELSRGTMQKINIARILMSPSKLLLLDEPETGLDKASLLPFYTAALALPKKTIIWASHLLDFNEKHGNTPFFTHKLRIMAENYAEITLNPLCVNN